MPQSDPNKKFADESSKKLLKRAYRLSTSDDAKKLYRDWAQTYDHHLETGLKYQGPKKIATLFANAMTDRSSPVLDIGCGTGLVADHLVGESFANVVGLDFSPEMLAEADRKDIYRFLIEADLEEKLLIEDATYAGAISCGTFTHGHVGPSAFREIFRVLEQGAPFACTIHSQLWTSAGFDQALAILENERVMSIETISDESYFEGESADGKFCIFRKI
ncbi:MAG: class I SAM-dependent methyltransferase [Proteobacteria bacterium]|nr:class I SAM-dependent methyltransferase [Pseudomonadota bacterium]